jgi:hypothetical protein
VTATRSLADLRGLSEKSLELVIKSWRAAQMSDEEIVTKLRETFIEQPSVQTAILKCLGGYKQPRPSTIEKARGPLSNTVAGAVAGAMIRGGLVASVEKGYDDLANLPDARIAKAKPRLDAPDEGVAHDLTHRIRKAAEAAKQ